GQIDGRSSHRANLGCRAAIVGLTIHAARVAGCRFAGRRCHRAKVVEGDWRETPTLALGSDFFSSLMPFSVTLLNSRWISFSDFIPASVPMQASVTWVASSESQVSAVSGFRSTIPALLMPSHSFK